MLLLAWSHGAGEGWLVVSLGQGLEEGDALLWLVVDELLLWLRMLVEDEMGWGGCRGGSGEAERVCGGRGGHTRHCGVVHAHG